MGYFEAKADLAFIHQFRNDAMRYKELEDQVHQFMEYAHNRRFPPTNEEMDRLEKENAGLPEEFMQLREKMVKSASKATRIANKNGMNVVAKSLPPPAFGGYVIPVNIFEAIYHDESHNQQIQPFMIMDTINRTIGLCEERVEREWKQLINPLHWIRFFFTFVLRIPFMLIEATGFNVSKVEDHLLGKVFKLIYLIALFYVLARLGLRKESFIELIKGLITK